ATHSLNLIDRVDIADVVQLRLDDRGRTLAERLVDESHEGVDRYLSQLSAAMGLRTSVLRKHSGLAVALGLFLLALRDWRWVWFRPSPGWAASRGSRRGRRAGRSGCRCRARRRWRCSRGWRTGAG